MRTYYVYIMSNKRRTTFYIGVTNNVERRVYEHREGIYESFTKRYRLTDVVYVEATNDVLAALEREKQLKRWHRPWKLNLIRSVNPKMKDLASDFIQGDSETSSE